MGDIAERALWPQYQAVYQDVVRHTSTPLAPWHVVPADYKSRGSAIWGDAPG